ncbi:phosphotyrosine protein phosphatase [Mycolicibacterium cyprinidarum]|uniref:Phosphotyrosine protein phosphatase n=1 Tax=Mycolicibacterium cyprinidarum TaxID=2860311 RepID=A0ABQ4VAB9_9MYCO|nr:phosphotyrosine protein phosphatase [Mycolicibacterium sp. NGTWS1803]GJF15278.1 phosphotyrosine protein phosphatase [Mycolicibacterium sp. NGTWSNA01]GJF16396.1 phosphotyrosine protein phosphatase [Mycolicibacterium sp. NGTWS0302]
MTSADGRQHLALSGAWNFRDVSEQAGIAPGRFFRASELSNLDEAGRSALTRYGVTDVADLRTLRELESHGSGLVPAGVAVHHLPFVETTASDGEAPHEHAFRQMMTDKPSAESVGEAAARYMTEEYVRIAGAPLAQRAVQRVVALLGSDRRVLAHCFAGKDRTGFTIAVVLEAAGVGRDAIMTDYLRSNAAVPQLRESILASVRKRAAETPEILEMAEARLTESVLGVREDYLDAARRSIDDGFGSLKNYLEAAGVTAEDLDRLRATLNN